MQVNVSFMNFEVPTHITCAHLTPHKKRTLFTLTFQRRVSYFYLQGHSDPSVKIVQTYIKQCVSLSLPDLKPSKKPFLVARVDP